MNYYDLTYYYKELVERQQKKNEEVKTMSNYVYGGEILSARLSPEGLYTIELSYDPYDPNKLNWNRPDLMEDKPSTKYHIDTIYHNPEKNTTVVKFVYKAHRIVADEDGKPKSIFVKRIKVKKDADDPEDVYDAVASAIMIRKYKSNSQFKTHIRKSMPGGFEGRPQTYQMIAACEVSKIFGSWEAFCKLVDDKLEDGRLNKNELKLGKQIDKLRREGMNEKDIVTKLGLKGVTELRRLRASFAKSNKEVNHGKRKKTNTK